MYIDDSYNHVPIIAAPPVSCNENGRLLNFHQQLDAAASGRVDHRTRRHFNIIRKGEPIAHLEPEIRRMDGVDVTGELIPHGTLGRKIRQNGKNTTFHEGIEHCVYTLDRITTGDKWAHNRRGGTLGARGHRQSDWERAGGADYRNHPHRFYCAERDTTDKGTASKAYAHDAEAG